MRRMRLAVGCLLLVGFGMVGAFAQNNSPYPKNAEGVIDFAETLFKTDFSAEQIVKRLGTKTKNEDDDEYFFSLEPYSSGRGTVEHMRLYVDDEDKKLTQVDFKFIKPVQISYGAMRKKYGLLKKLPSPIVNCGPGNDCNRKLFVGYYFEQSRLVGKKKVTLSIHLRMKADGKNPKHNDQSILEIEEISFRRQPDFL